MFIVADAIAATVFLITLAYGHFVEAASTIPALFSATAAIIFNRDTARIPPLSIYLTLGIIAYFVAIIDLKDSPYAQIIIEMLAGLVIGISGLILAYVSLNAKPGTDNDRPIFSLFLSFVCSLSLFSMLMIIQYVLFSFGDTINGYQNPLMPEYAKVMRELIITFVTSAILCFLFYIGPDALVFKFIIMEYDSNNLWIDSPKDIAYREIWKIVSLGECETVEFKSTLSTNIKTGEQDSRMEMVVLKTIVAFMNSEGGNLLIGVSNDGTVDGADTEQFSSPDDMELHLTSLVTKCIGKEFIHFISIRMADIDGKLVLRVMCLKSNRPVFLREGREEKFYARVGPSSVCLTDKELLNYSHDHFKKLWVRKQSRRPNS
jgi:hypothetical protein